jgi:hypothetical protein
MNINIWEKSIDNIEKKMASCNCYKNLNKCNCNKPYSPDQEMTKEQFELWVEELENYFYTKEFKSFSWRKRLWIRIQIAIVQMLKF